jgi:flagellar hook-associated protein 1 FlgK
LAGDLTLALRAAQSGLLANQHALDGVAQNVANVNTPGYSRKIVSLETRSVAGVGAGVDMARFGRQVDEGLLRTLRTEMSTLGRVQVGVGFDARVQDLFGNLENNSSLSHQLGRLQAAFESLALDPHSGLNQQEVVRLAEQTAADFRHTTTTLQSMRQEADRRIAETADAITRLTAEIADLNSKIERNRLTGHEVGDLEDARDRALDALAGKIDIKTIRPDDGSVVVFAGSGQTLVDRTGAIVSHQSAAALTAGMSYAGGNIAGIFAGAGEGGTDITPTVQGGELAGLIALRDRTLPNLQAALDELAGGLRDTVNRIHNAGVAYPGLQQATGSRQFAAPDSQSIEFVGSADSRLVVLDGDGRQVATTTVRTLIGGATTSVRGLETAIDQWLTAGGFGSAAIDGDGRMTVQLGSGHYLAVRDEAATATAGSATASATIAFDADGDAVADETVEGFSFFLGLNDFFADASAAGNVGDAGSLAVRADLVADPGRIARGAVQWDASLGLGGAYALGIADDTVARTLAETFATGSSFDAAGGLAATRTTFDGYAAAIIQQASTIADSNAGRAATQQGLVESLQQKVDGNRGVNLDEELSDLMLYEQAYAAAARLIGVIKDMFDALDRAVA